MRGLKSMRLVAIGVVAALFASACGGGGGTETPEGGGELKAYLGEPEHLIPGNTNETQGGTVLRNLYSGLIKYDADGKPTNEIAESIESDDQTVWTIKLKKGYKFHNDEPVNADSFINAWNFVAYGPNANGNSYFMDRIEGYEDLQAAKEGEEPKAKEMTGLSKVDDYTFEVTLKEPFQAFNMMVGYTAFYPMAKECLDDVKACEESPIGNGPFKMDGKWEHDKIIKTVRNDDYAGTKAKLDKLTFNIFKDEDSGWAALQSGEVDVMTTIPAANVGEARTSYGDRLIEEPNSTFTYLGFPTYDKKFEN
ncbi:MAG: ABC transporter substrate-binding protein, partial [Micromonosporaceae bacterium]|nr:ABC transporter substrate-binding protein [Micromonosporaceae bacterium]